MTKLLTQKALQVMPLEGSIHELERWIYQYGSWIQWSWEDLGNVFKQWCEHHPRESLLDRLKWLELVQQHRVLSPDDGQRIVKKDEALLELLY